MKHCGGHWRQRDMALAIVRLAPHSAYFAFHHNCRHFAIDAAANVFFVSGCQVAISHICLHPGSNFFFAAFVDIVGGT